MINPAKIKDVIGKGGETITKIICEASNVTEVTNINAVKVELEDDGRVIIYHSDKEIIEKTKAMIEEIVREVEVGKIYEFKKFNEKSMSRIESGRERRIIESEYQKSLKEAMNNFSKISQEKMLYHNQRKKLKKKKKRKKVNNSFFFLTLCVIIPVTEGDRNGRFN